MAFVSSLAPPDSSSSPHAARYAMALMLSAPAAPWRSSLRRVSSFCIIWSSRRSNSLVGFLGTVSLLRSGLGGYVVLRGQSVRALRLAHDVDVLVRPGQSNGVARPRQPAASRLVGVRD